MTVQDAIAFTREVHHQVPAPWFSPATAFTAAALPRAAACEIIRWPFYHIADASWLVLRIAPGGYLSAYTLRGLASNGYWPTEAQGAAIREWLATREQVVAAFDAGEITLAEAHLAYKPSGLLLQDCGFTLDDTRRPWAE